MLFFAHFLHKIYIYTIDLSSQCFWIMIMELNNRAISPSFWVKLWSKTNASVGGRGLAKRPSEQLRLHYRKSYYLKRLWSYASIVDARLTEFKAWNDATDGWKSYDTTLDTGIINRDYVALLKHLKGVIAKNGLLWRTRKKYFEVFRSISLRQCKVSKNQWKR